jgi:hypothetical protein
MRNNAKRNQVAFKQDEEECRVVFELTATAASGRNSRQGIACLQEQREHIDEVGAVEGITADTDASGLTKTSLGERVSKEGERGKRAEKNTNEQERPRADRRKEKRTLAQSPLTAVVCATASYVRVPERETMPI